MNGFDFASPVSDEKLLRRPPPPPDTTPTKIEVTRNCYINGFLVEAGRIVTITREDAFNVIAANRGKLVD
jgi:hypothetical protein